MRVALINNGTKEPKKLLQLLAGNDVEIFDIAEVGSVDSSRFDLLVLSGSSKVAIEHGRDKIASELQLIRESPIPVIGICYGCQMIAVAFGGTLKQALDKKLQDQMHITVDVPHPMFSGRTEFNAYDSHRWVVDTVPDEFEVVAHSEHGPEVIRHKARPIFGFQFHPEQMTDETLGDEIFHNTLESLENKNK